MFSGSNWGVCLYSLGRVYLWYPKRKGLEGLHPGSGTKSSSAPSSVDGREKSMISARRSGSFSKSAVISSARIGVGTECSSGCGVLFAGL